MRVGQFLNLAKLPLLALQKQASITPNKQPTTNQQPPNESHWKYFKLFLVSSWKKLGGNIPLLIKHHKWEFNLSKCFLLTNLEDEQETNIFSEDMGEIWKETWVYLWMCYPEISEYLSQLKITVNIYKRDIYFLIQTSILKEEKKNISVIWQAQKTLFWCIKTTQEWCYTRHSYIRTTHPKEMLEYKGSCKFSGGKKNIFIFTKL